MNRREVGPVRLVNLSLNGTVVELREAEEPVPNNDDAFDHIALRVLDIWKAIELIKTQGVEFITSEPKSIGLRNTFSFSGGRPGEEIELKDWAG